MRRFFKLLVRIGTLVGLSALVLKATQMFKGAPEGVGTEGFQLSADTDDDPYAVDESTLGGDVNPELLARLVCPLDKGPLELVDGKWLVNPRNGYRYPISDGIPVMLIEVGERYRDPAFVAAPGAVPATRGDDGTV